MQCGCKSLLGICSAPPTDPILLPRQVLLIFTVSVDLTPSSRHSRHTGLCEELPDVNSAIPRASVCPLTLLSPGGWGSLAHHHFPLHLSQYQFLNHWISTSPPPKYLNEILCDGFFLMKSWKMWHGEHWPSWTPSP